MPFKVKHYAQPINTNVKSATEAAVIEFAIGCICAVFAYFTRDIIIQLYISMTILAVACFLLTLHNIYVIFALKKDAKKLVELADSDK